MNAPCIDRAGERPPRAARTIRVGYFNAWARGLEDAAAYIARAPTIDLASLVADPRDAALLKKARLDCDWYAENARCFASLPGDAGKFLPALVCGPAGLVDFAKLPRAADEERWLITMGHQPQALGAAAGKAFALLARAGVRHLFYAFDEASRFMPGFAEIAPHLDVLIHDESPLAERGRRALRPGCVTRHRSWVANVRPFAVPFNEAPEEKILFLGSTMGLTPHRARQLAFLRERFGDRLVASHDHSIGIAERDALSRYKVGFCPEGRKFATPAMSATHTDRPFWSGCLGLVPVSEDSHPSSLRCDATSTGGRLEELHRAGLIVRYPHGDLAALAAACERALSLPNAERKKIHEHFNRHETIGAVVMEAMSAAAG